MYKVVSYTLSNIVSVILSDYQYNVRYPISAWQTIQHCLAYAIGLAGYHWNINLMEVITGIFSRKLICMLRNWISKYAVYCHFWYDVWTITITTEWVAQNTENIKNSGFAIIALYKLVPVQSPPIQLTALQLPSITMVSVFCWPYPASLTSFSLYSLLSLYGKPLLSQVWQL